MAGDKKPTMNFKPAQRDPQPHQRVPARAPLDESPRVSQAELSRPTAVEDSNEMRSNLVPTLLLIAIYGSIAPVLADAGAFLIGLE